MARKPAFTEAEVRRILNGVIKAGFTPQGISVHPQHGLSVTLNASVGEGGAGPANPWDEELKA